MTFHWCTDNLLKSCPKEICQKYFSEKWCIFNSYFTFSYRNMVPGETKKLPTNKFSSPSAWQDGRWKPVDLIEVESYYREAQACRNLINLNYLIQNFLVRNFEAGNEEPISRPRWSRRRRRRRWRTPVRRDPDEHVHAAEDRPVHLQDHWVRKSGEPGNLQNSLRWTSAIDPFKTLLWGPMFN